MENSFLNIQISNQLLSLKVQNVHVLKVPLLPRLNFYITQQSLAYSK